MSQRVEKYFEENKPYAGLGRKSLCSGVIYVIARGINIFMQVASTVPLARLLSPCNFGLFAVTLVLTGLGPALIDSGASKGSM